MFGKKVTIILPVVLLLLVLSAVGVIVNRNQTDLATVAGTSVEVESEIGVKIGAVDLETIIDFQKGMTALEATRLAVKGDMVTSGEGSGAFVVEILGRTAEKTEREYWELLVNGESALVGAGSLELKPGDKIEWKLSKF